MFDESFVEDVSLLLLSEEEYTKRAIVAMVSKVINTNPDITPEKATEMYTIALHAVIFNLLKIIAEKSSNNMYDLITEFSKAMHQIVRVYIEIKHAKDRK